MQQYLDYDVIIIGGGASGLMLAASLELSGKGVVLEKTSALGTKLLMSGGGRCNITHGGSIKDFLYAYGDAGPRLRKCLYRHSNIELVNWLEDHGIALSDEKGNPVSAADLSDAGRVFPASMKASDVLGALLDSARANGWEIRTEADVFALERTEADVFALERPEEGGVSECLSSCWVVKTGAAGNFRAPVVVLATGGITYPETGSDGAMFEILRSLGVEITEPRSALAPIYVDDYPYEELSGISISDVTVTAFSQDAATTCKGKAARMTGDLLFTHTGFSGPVMLNISRYAEPGEYVRISYNKNMNDLPRRMQHILEKRAQGPSGDVRTTVLAGLLDHDDFVVSSVGENGMVTAGGISLSSIDMQTMQLCIDDCAGTDTNIYSCAGTGTSIDSGAGTGNNTDSGAGTGNNTGASAAAAGGNYLNGLFAIGEAIDADGITGGYNLQMCWSTARTAADAIMAIGDRM